MRKRIWRSFDYLDEKQSRLNLLNGYQQWIGSYVHEGWKPYEISFMFHQLPGSTKAILEQMKQELHRSPLPCHVLGDRGLPDVDAKLE